MLPPWVHGGVMCHQAGTDAAASEASAGLDVSIMLQAVPLLTSRRGEACWRRALGGQGSPAGAAQLHAGRQLGSRCLLRGAPLLAASRRVLLIQCLQQLCELCQLRPTPGVPRTSSRGKPSGGDHWRQRGQPDATARPVPLQGLSAQPVLGRLRAEPALQLLLPLAAAGDSRRSRLLLLGEGWRQVLPHLLRQLTETTATAEGVGPRLLLHLLTLRGGGLEASTTTMAAAAAGHGAHHCRWWCWLRRGSFRDCHWLRYGVSLSWMWRACRWANCIGKAAGET